MSKKLVSLVNSNTFLTDAKTLIILSEPPAFFKLDKLEIKNLYQNIKVADLFKIDVKYRFCQIPSIRHFDFTQGHYKGLSHHLYPI
jgi:hypothetical protein